MNGAIAQRTGKSTNARVIHPIRLAHVVVRTKNVAKLVDWYTLVFQAESVFNNGRLAFLYFDDEHHRIAIGEVPDLEAPNHAAAGFDHVAFTYGNIGDLLETYDRLKEQAIEPYFKIDHGPTMSLYYKDPDGNQVELQVDNFLTRDEAHQYFRSAAFAKNPLGIEIDPDALLERYRSGEDLVSLLSAGTKTSL